MRLDLQQINDEVTNDPEGLGYAGKTRQQQADLLNDATLSTRASMVIPTHRLHAEVIDFSEVETLMLDDPAYTRFIAYLGVLPEQIDIASANAQGVLAKYLGNGASVANAQAMCRCSRSHRLFGQDVTAHIVEQAFGEA